MNPKERFETALNLGRPDRVPVAPIFQGYWALDRYGVTVPESMSNPRKAAEAILRAQEECPFDAIEVVWDWVAPVDAVGCKSRITDKSSPIVVEPAIKNLADIKQLKPVDISNHPRVYASMESARIILEELGKDVFCYATIAQPFTFANQMRRADYLMLDLYKNPSAVHELLEYTTNLVIEHAKICREIGVHGIFPCDGAASGDLLSPKHYREFVAPYTKRLDQAAKEMGIYHIQHVCGNTTKNLDIVLEISPQAYSFDYPVDIGVTKQKIGSKICLVGNIDPSGILLLGTPEKVKEVTRSCIEKGWENGGFIIGSG
ncbi:MAG: uroporphyrinogen decarboxylase family protein [Bacillota bacterium]